MNLLDDLDVVLINRDTKPNALLVPGPKIVFATKYKGIDGHVSATFASPSGKIVNVTNSLGLDVEELIKADRAPGETRI